MQHTAKAGKRRQIIITRAIQMATFNQLVNEKTLKRADAMKARLSDLKEKDGFNWRHEGEDLAQSIRTLADFIVGGGKLPDVEVTTDLELVDGHRRIRAYRLVETESPEFLDHLRDKEGTVWVGVKPFEGGELERNARVLTSNEGRKLTSLELAEGYQRMRDLGASNEQIAKLVNKTRGHVDQMFVLDSAPEPVKEAIKQGEISATEAVKLVRDHKEGSTEELASRKQAAGEKKVTAKVAPKKSKANDSRLAEAVRGFVASIDEGIRERILLGTLEYVEVDCAFLAEIIEASNNLSGDEK
jgi:ParB-like chromosome segregation protein Spo0J